MSTFSLTVGAVCCLLAALLFLCWTHSLRRTAMKANADFRVISSLLLAVYFFSTIALGDRNSSALIQEGLSGQNRLQIVVVMVASCWALLLIVTNRVPMRTLVAGANFWVCCLVMLFALSTAWSVWPQLTIYRTFELVVFWILTVHIVSSSADWRSSLLHLFLVIGIPTLFTPRMLDLTRGRGLDLGGGNNIGSFVAAICGLIFLGRVIYDGRRSWRMWEKVAVVGYCLCISSLGSALSLIVSAVVLASWLLPGSVRRWGAGGGVFLLVVLSVVVVAMSSRTFLGMVARAAEYVGRDPRLVYNLTGRLPLWTAIWDYSKDSPFGLGFVAGERTFAIEYASSSEVGWKAINAHNGYVSAWVGGGWCGVMFTIFLLYGITKNLLGRSSPERSLGLSLLTLILLNNFVIPATGYAFGPGWVLLMALAALPAASVNGTVRANRFAPAGRLVSGLRYNSGI